MSELDFTSIGGIRIVAPSTVVVTPKDVQVNVNTPESSTPDESIMVSATSPESSTPDEGIMVSATSPESNTPEESITINIT